MKPNLSQDDVITISFCLGYTMGKIPIKKERIIEVMKKITEPLIRQTKKEVRKALK